ncbi:hypothetical protein B0H13DRAFT_2326329 [Mycena leptocephala]|nr:hypothetical protein B0H13DRAFT_2326329 [Mycena leptocephala]
MPPLLLLEYRTLSGIENWDVVRMGISRPNIRLEVEEYKTAQDRVKTLVELIRQTLLPQFSRLNLSTRNKSPPAGNEYYES